jgi:hypothetical protein
MARRHWFELHGYAQFTMYSMNIDGLMDDVAHHAGIREEVLSMPRCIYHLEHEQGSGWTPEGEGLLRKRLSESGADWLDAATVDLWSAYGLVEAADAVQHIGLGFRRRPEITVDAVEPQVREDARGNGHSRSS